MDDSLKVGSNEMELVDFRIFKEEKGEVYEGIYGINVSKVREIIKMPILTELPNTQDYIEGIFELRNIVIPVIDLALWMGMIAPKSADVHKKVIITEFNNMLIGFIVHDAKRIRRISWANIEPAGYMAGSGGVDGSKITGITEIEGENVLLILDLESVVQDLGLYNPDIENTPVNMETFSGIALVLDDSSTARKIVVDALEKMGFSVVEAGDGQEGLEKLYEMYNIYGDDINDTLRIIISDVEMPRMDGFHFAEKVKSDTRFESIPVLFNSSISDSFSEERGLNAGGDGYLVKFDTSMFYDEIARVIRVNMK
jgi:two-component system chemotaxis response regulator CheV